MMQRTPIDINREDIPAVFHPFLEGAAVFDSSCSRRAGVYLLDKGPGFFLKTAPKGKLQREAEMTAYFHSKGLSAQVLAYESLDRDWMLTRRIPGEDCLDRLYMEEPRRLCDLTAQLLRQLHEESIAHCPAPDRTGECLAAARRNYENKTFDDSHFPDNWGYATAEEAWEVLEQRGKYLKKDTLLHGDYCLPNILLDNWKFSGFIDLDSAGVGDRHMDLFWGIWSLEFNLKTDRYRDRFLDAYGREHIEEELFRAIAAMEVFR